MPKHTFIIKIPKVSKRISELAADHRYHFDHRGQLGGLLFEEPDRLICLAQVMRGPYCCC